MVCIFLCLLTNLVIMHALFNRNEVQDKDLKDITVFQNASYHSRFSSVNTEEDFSFVDSWIGSRGSQTYDYARFSPQSESSEPFRAILYPTSGSGSAKFHETSESYVNSNDCASLPASDGNETQHGRARGLSDSYVRCTPPPLHTHSVRTSLPASDENETQRNDDNRPRGLSDSYVPCTPPPLHTGIHCPPQQPPSTAERAETEKKSRECVLQSAHGDDPVVAQGKEESLNDAPVLPKIN